MRHRLATGPTGALEVDHAWIDEYAAAGDPATVAARLDALYRAGARAVAVWLFPSGALHEQLDRLARDVLPLLEPRTPGALEGAPHRHSQPDRLSERTATPPV